MINQLISSAHTQNSVGKLKAPSSVITQVGDLGSFFSTIVSIIVAIAGIWFLVRILLGGLSYITGAGDQKKTSEAMKKITDSIIGMIIVAAAFIIVSIVGALLFGITGFNILSPELKTITP